MPNDTYMDMGGYQFGLETAAYNEVRRQWQWRWAQQDVLNGRPYQQYIGPGHVELSLNGYVTPHFKGGLGQVDEMRAEADRGEPLQVVDSLGNVWGDFVITQISETRRDIGPAGLPMRIEFRLQLMSTELNRGGEEAAAATSTSAPLQFNT